MGPRSPETRAVGVEPETVSFEAVSERTLELTRELGALEEVLSQLQVDLSTCRDRLEAERAQCSRLSAQVAETEETAERLGRETTELEVNLRIARRETTLIDQRASEDAQQANHAERDIDAAKVQLGTLGSTFAEAADALARMEYKIRSSCPSGNNDGG